MVVSFVTCLKTEIVSHAVFLCKVAASKTHHADTASDVGLW